MYKDLTMEQSIEACKEIANERSPIRWDSYLRHMSYMEGRVRQLEEILNNYIPFK